MFAHKLETPCFTLCDRRDRRGGDQHHALSIHPRLRKLWRRVPMFAIGLLLRPSKSPWPTPSHHALLFACIVMAIGLTLRQLRVWPAPAGPKPSLLRQAIIEQLPPEALARRRYLHRQPPVSARLARNGRCGWRARRTPRWSSASCAMLPSRIRWKPRPV